MRAPNLRARLLEELRNQFDGDPWHGRPLVAILKDVGAAQASARLGAAHTIWELVRHITAWTREVRRRLEGAEAGEPREGDFPVVETASPPAWRAAQRELARSHHQLVRTVARIAPARLNRPVRDFRGSSDGVGRTAAETILGLIQHDVYHAGQIALLKRLTGRVPRRRSSNTGRRRRRV